MQSTVSYYDNYEKFDCKHFYSSINGRAFDSDDIKSANLDEEAVNEYFEIMKTPAEVESADATDSHNKIPNYTAIKF